MMTYLKVVGGVAVNKAIFDGAMPESWASAGETWVQSDTAQIGWAYANGSFVAPEPGPSRALSVDDIVEERKRRLALGFDYDFGDARGLHHIGTTPDDMTGWRDVIDYANALIDLGDTSTQIAIVTDTGPTLVTAPEWQAVMLRAAQVRQIIWAKSFLLQAMSPIPSDYANDSYWT